MNLGKKKELAKRTLGVGKGRIAFAGSRLEDIKEAITKQDIKDLHKEGAIVIKPIKGRRKVLIKKKRRSVGNVRVRVNTRKRDYVTLTRKLRKYLSALKERGEISKEEYEDIRKKIRNKIFRSKAHLKDYLGGLRK